MHETSWRKMGELMGKFCGPGQTVLDCGSAMASEGLQKSYREIAEEMKMLYLGFDAQEGKNVDLVGDIYTLASQLGENYADVVISGQMLEHLEMPLAAAQEMKLAVKPGGIVIWIAPWQYGEHRYPIDCWRVLPDGMRFLLEGFEVLEVGKEHNDCWGVGRKPEDYKEPWTVVRRC